MSGFRVALVSDWFLPRMGGIELHLRDLAVNLSADGHDVRIITTTPGPDVVEGIRVHRLGGSRLPALELAWTAKPIRAIGEILERERVDVAHCHVSIVSPAAFGGGYQAQRRRIPTVLTFHSIVPRMPALMRALDLGLGCSRWPAAFSAVSALVASSMRPIAGSAPIQILPNGVDPEYWHTIPRRSDGDTIELIAVMRLNAKKRPFTLIRMMRDLVRDEPAGRFVRLRIVGDGPLRARVASAIAHAGLEHRIQLVGQIDRSELRTLFANADIFVLPCIHESFGLAALEARCAGLPVVAMARSGVAEFITHEREGLLADSDDDITRHVRRLVVDDLLRDRIATHNRRTTPEADWPQSVREHRDVYETAIELAAGRQPVAASVSRQRMAAASGQRQPSA